ncbi:hypothetical protein EYC84_005238 [Monilinia fructicola]|uniref:Uncharacterized protein n=1 Tax=Monilinia fructicola TaxID=38448 RepID=A0A5M9K0J1_MONFR|nr:hypothetical protein EYC84_005238 [Monilinia fructicola]
MVNGWMGGRCCWCRHVSLIDAAVENRTYLNVVYMRMEGFRRMVRKVLYPASVNKTRYHIRSLQLQRVQNFHSKIRFPISKTRNIKMTSEEFT